MTVQDAAETDAQQIQTDDVRIAGIRERAPPAHLRREFPVLPAAFVNSICPEMKQKFELKKEP